MKTTEQSVGGVNIHLNNEGRPEDNAKNTAKEILEVVNNIDIIHVEMNISPRLRADANVNNLSPLKAIALEDELNMVKEMKLSVTDNGGSISIFSRQCLLQAGKRDTSSLSVDRSYIFPRKALDMQEIRHKIASDPLFTTGDDILLILRALSIPLEVIQDDDDIPDSSTTSLEILYLLYNVVKEKYTNLDRLDVPSHPHKTIILLTDSKEEFICDDNIRRCFELLNTSLVLISIGAINGVPTAGEGHRGSNVSITNLLEAFRASKGLKRERSLAKREQAIWEARGTERSQELQDREAEESAYSDSEPESNSSDEGISDNEYESDEGSEHTFVDQMGTYINTNASASNYEDLAAYSEVLKGLDISSSDSDDSTADELSSSSTREFRFNTALPGGPLWTEDSETILQNNEHLEGYSSVKLATEDDLELIKHNELEEENLASYEQLQHSLSGQLQNDMFSGNLTNRATEHLARGRTIMQHDSSSEDSSNEDILANRIRWDDARDSEDSARSAKAIKEREVREAVQDVMKKQNSLESSKESLVEAFVAEDSDEYEPVTSTTKEKRNFNPFVSPYEELEIQEMPLQPTNNEVEKGASSNLLQGKIRHKEITQTAEITPSRSEMPGVETPVVEMYETEEIKLVSGTVSENSKEAQAVALRIVNSLEVSQEQGSKLLTGSEEGVTRRKNAESWSANFDASLLDSWPISESDAKEEKEKSAKKRQEKRDKTERRRKREERREEEMKKTEVTSKLSQSVTSSIATSAGEGDKSEEDTGKDSGARRKDSYIHTSKKEWRKRKHKHKLIRVVKTHDPKEPEMEELLPPQKDELKAKAVSAKQELEQVSYTPLESYCSVSSQEEDARSVEKLIPTSKDKKRGNKKKKKVEAVFDGRKLPAIPRMPNAVKDKLSKDPLSSTEIPLGQVSRYIKSHFLADSERSQYSANGGYGFNYKQNISKIIAKELKLPKQKNPALTQGDISNLAKSDINIIKRFTNSLVGKTFEDKIEPVLREDKKIRLCCLTPTW